MAEDSVPHEEASRAVATPPRASRVLVVTTRWDLVGGSERYAGDVVRALRERGLSVPVLCAEGEQEGADEVHRFAPLAAERLTRAERRALRDLVRALRPDAIYLLSRAREDALRLLLDAAPLVRFVQDHTLFCPGLNKLHEDGTPCESPLGLACLERYYTGVGCSGFKATGPPSLRWPHATLATHLRELELTKRCRRVLVASRYMRTELLRAGLPASLVEVLPYFTSPNRPTPEPLDAATQAFLDADERPLLLTPARLVLPDKGVDYLLTALGHLDGRAKLVLAGDGPARAWLEQKAADEHLTPHVHFTGWLPPGRLETLYAACDVVVFPSVWNEPFGLVGLEARAHGKPVVAFDVGGVREWFDPDGAGELVERGNALELADAIEQSLLPGRGGSRLDATVPNSAPSTREHTSRLAAILGRSRRRVGGDPGNAGN